MAIFLGTGAAQGFPCPYCKCPTCEDARRLGGRAVKSRSDFLIDEKNIIDFGPDVYWQFMSNGLVMDGIENIFLTHSHEDHIAVSELGVIANRKHTLEKPVSVNMYGPKAALEVVKRVAVSYVNNDGNTDENPYFKHIKFCPLEPFVAIETGGIKVTPIMSSHLGYGKDELGFNYIVEKNGKTMLYASDTGWYGDDTWEFLKNSDLKFDYVIMENTYGSDARNIVKPYATGHLNTANFIKMLEKMAEFGCMTCETPVYAIHLSDACRELFGEFVGSMENNPNWNITVAYDSMKLDF